MVDEIGAAVQVVVCRYTEKGRYNSFRLNELSETKWLKDFFFASIKFLKCTKD